MEYKKFERMTEYQIATAASKNDIKNMMFWSWWPFYKFRFDAFQLPFYSKTVEKYGMNNVKWVKRQTRKAIRGSLLDCRQHYRHQECNFNWC